MVRWEKPGILGESNPRQTGRIEGSVRAQTAVPGPSGPLSTTSVQVPSLLGGPEDNDAPTGPPSPAVGPKEPRSTRVSRAWNGLVPALVLLVVILVFIFQNLHKTRVSFLVFSGTLPLAFALLAAAAFGGLFVLTLGSIRMAQLRKVIRRSQKSGAHAHSAPGAQK